MAQVRFSEVIAIEKYLPDIQEKLRHKGFPRFLRGQAQEVTLLPDGPKFRAIERFEFQNKEAFLGIVLQSNSVAVHTSRYSNYESFEENIQTALMTIQRVVDISLSERIGLRYVNLIRLGEAEKWSNYLNPGLLGVDPHSVGVDTWNSRSEYVGKTAVGTLAVRCWQSQQTLPPDLVGGSGLLNSSITLTPGEIVTTLDFDHFLEKPLDFKVPHIVSVFEQLHQNLDKVFETSVTPKALVKWGKEES